MPTPFALSLAVSLALQMQAPIFEGRLYAVDIKARVAIVRVYSPVRRTAYVDLGTEAAAILYRRTSDANHDRPDRIGMLVWRLALPGEPAAKPRSYRGHRVEASRWCAWYIADRSQPPGNSYGLH